MQRSTIREHFEHPDYPLEKHTDHREYICGGCDTPGFGSRYRCDACNFEMHEYCSYCPNNLSSSMHPHDLILVTSNHLETRPSCNICLESLTGFHYTCQPCGFDVHPLCTQLPEELFHVVDDSHPLKLQRLMSSGSCVVCKTDCSLWCYGCDFCKVSIHLQCLLEPYVSPDANSGEEPPLVPRPDQPIPSPWQNSSSHAIPSSPPPWSSQASQLPPPCTSGGLGYNPAIRKGYSDGAFSYGFSAYGTLPNTSGYGHPYGYGVPYYGVPYGYGYGYGYDYDYDSSYGYPNGPVGPPYYYANQQRQAGASTSSSRGKLAKSMFSLVGNLTTALMSNVVLGSLGFSSF